MTAKTQVEIVTSTASVGQPVTERFAIERIMSPEEVFETLYGDCRKGSYIAMGSRRRKGNGEIGIIYLTIFPKEDWWKHFSNVLDWKPEQTKYICPNTFTRCALIGKAPKRFITDLFRRDRPCFFERWNDHVRELVAVTVDLDVGREPTDITAPQALEVVRQMVVDGTIPAPSLVSFSGHGLYLQWLLREPDGLRPPLKTTVTAFQFSQITSELLARTRHLEGDPKATAMSNWFKAPGTMDTKTGKEVIYMPFDHSIPRYTLQQLMDNLQLVNDRSKQRNRVTCNRSVPKAKRELTDGRAKSAVPYLKRSEDIVKLAKHRGGVQEGWRDEALFQLFSAVRASYSMVYDPEVAKKGAEARLHEFNDTYCNPPMSPSDLESIITRKRYLYEPRSETVAMKLGITLKEAEACDLRALKPRELKMKEEMEKQAKQEARELKWRLVDEGIEVGKPVADIIQKLQLHAITVKPSYIYNRRSRLRKLQKAAPNE